MRGFFFAAILSVFLVSCARQVVTPPLPPGEPPPPVSAPPAVEGLWSEKGPLLQNSDWHGFSAVIETVLPALDKDPERIFTAGGKNFTAASLSSSLKRFKDLASAGKTPVELVECLSDNFDLVELSSAGEKAFFTAYYVPEFSARSKANETFRYPLYSPPKDLVSLKLFPLGPGFRNAVFRGRIDENGKLVPYHTREEIDGEKALAGRGLEFAYLSDPLDVLILQIQGSGRLVLEDGTVRLAAYAGKNGHPYKSIGRYMADKAMLPIEEVSWNNIKAFLREHPERLEEILYSNPSYVFFKLKDAGAVVGSLGLPLTPYHSVAVDNRHIPPLSLCLVDLKRPLIGEDGLVKAFVPMGELSFAMDEGSAILGPARVDIFLGSGAEAERLAGTLRGEGALYLLVPRTDHTSPP